ncbi:MAG: hypothetical protein A3I74_03535 [Candidatus Magasanikbacteria bacterium RIFCSPLOWO2_02_FULL_47_16]|nr:MAG: hypothetical protein A3I74_03535 [Candidatus Magasanikbacteria bacterium RIFCSPLOWO2_02_FULL_47_16]
MIFSGSESKGQMGMASVTVTIDNRDKRADLEYDELVLTRRLYRSGESEYLVNGSPVRLLDVQLLLAKAQFGQGSYAIIGQGMIDRMLLQSMEERKDFFDEAAGIKEFQIKRHHAFLKLTRSREHIAQASVLLEEIAPRLKTLSRQVKKLEQRQEVESELLAAQESYYATLWTRAESERKKIEAVLRGKEKIYQEIAHRLHIIQEELAVLAKEESRQDIFAALQAAYQEKVREKNTVERERATLQGRLEIEYSKVGKQNVAWLEKKIEELKAQSAKLDREIADAEKKATALDARILEQKKQAEDLQIERATLRSAIASLQQDMMESKSQESLWHITGMKAVQAVLAERRRLGAIYGVVAQLGDVKTPYHLALDVAAGGRLSSLVVEDEGVAERCIQFLRRERLGVATFLPLNKIQPRILPQGVSNFLQEKGVHGFAVDCISFDPKFEHIFSYVLGNTLVVDTIEVARRIGIGRIRMVTLDGDMLETSGSMKGGFRSERGREGLSFAHGSASFTPRSPADIEGAIDEKRRSLEKIEMACEATQETIRGLQAEVEVARGKVLFLASAKQETEKEYASLAQERSLYSMSKSEYDSVMKDIAAEKERVETMLAGIEKQVEAAEKKMNAFNSDQEAKRQRVFALQDAMQTEQQLLHAVTEEKNAFNVDIAKLETKQEDLETEVYQELRETIVSIVARVETVLPVEALERTQAQIQKLKYTLSLIGGIDDDVIAEYHETKTRHDALAAELDDLNTAADDLETLIAELDTIMKKKRQTAFQRITKEFARYFSILFEGGKADLVEIYGREVPEDEGEEGNGGALSDDSEEETQKTKRGKKILQGIDIVACPPGKKIRDIQALSGGERTLTSLALVCAILHTNPPPFVVLDEVEAALDEANTLRFTDILRELAKQSQFILITHNRATMHAANALYGVTMGGGGTSHLLSVQLEEEKEERRP